MEKSTKQEYVAVPTSDVEEAQLPAYAKENPIDQTNKRCKRFRFLLIGGAIALLGLTHLGTKNYFNNFESADALADLENREPCALKHLGQYTELKQHMSDLQESFGFSGERFEAAATAAPHRHKEHKEHKEHKHHKGHHKHHKGDKPAPPSDEEVSDSRWFEEGSVDPVVTDDLSREVSIADSLVQGGHKKGKKPHHGHPHQPFCKVEELEASSSAFTFSPEEFQRAAVFLNGHFSRGGHVRLIKSSDESVTDVKINVTLYTGRPELQKEVKLSAFDHEGQYAVQIERGHFKGSRPHPRPRLPSLPHHPHRGDNDDDKEDVQGGHDDDDDDEKEDHKKENCLVYNVDIEFPSNVDYFEDLELHIKSAQRIQGGKGIEGVEFGSIKAGLGRGAIIFDGLRAKKLTLGVLRGVVMGTYQPSESFSAGSIHGATKVKIEPTGENINITATSTFGPASVDVPADSYSGDFVLFNIFGETSTIQAPNPEDVHVTKFRHTLKAGYYKEEHTGSRIVVAAKLHGGETLTFN